MTPLTELRDDTVETSIAQLDQEFDADGPALLDLTNVGEVDLFAGSLLANVLLRAWRDHEISVSVPQNHAALAAIASSGLGFALASLKHAQMSPEGTLLASPRMSASWTPGSRAPWDLMFGEAPADDGAAEVLLYRPEQAAFANVHRTNRPPDGNPITRLLRLWLQAATGEASLNGLGAAIDTASFFIDELVDNVRSHAVVGRPGGIESLLAVRLDGQAEQILQVTVMDTGLGVAATLRDKLGAHAPDGDDQLLRDLLAGNLPGWGRGRGVGLAALVARCANVDGASLSLRTAEWHATADGAGVDVDERSVVIHGTLVTARLPLTH